MKILRVKINIMLLYLFCLILIMFGCNKKNTEDNKKMQLYGEKLKSYVIKELDEYNASAANNMALASCFFAREMDCVAGNAPRLSTAANTQAEKRELGLVKFEEYRSRIEGMILKPDIDIPNMNETDYQNILGWVLSKDELKEIQEIREKHGYWTKLRTALAQKSN